eukprot:3861293-Lingulodinium_polyedra.AAC.1
MSAWPRKTSSSLHNVFTWPSKTIILSEAAASQDSGAGAAGGEARCSAPRSVGSQARSADQGHGRGGG